MASGVTTKTEPPTPLPTVPTADVWWAMTPEQRRDFQLQVIEALAKVKAERARAREHVAQARAVLTVLRARNIAVPDAEHDRILAETDAVRLERWLEKGVTAASLAEVLAEPTAG